MPSVREKKFEHSQVRGSELNESHMPAYDGLRTVDRGPDYEHSVNDLFSLTLRDKPQFRCITIK